MNRRSSSFQSLFNSIADTFHEGILGMNVAAAHSNIRMLRELLKPYAAKMRARIVPMIKDAPSEHEVSATLSKANGQGMEQSSP